MASHHRDRLPQTQVCGYGSLRRRDDSEFVARTGASHARFRPHL